MSTTATIKSILYSTIHRNNKTIDQLADELGISSNTLYRNCLEGESGSEMPMSRLVPLMKATKNYDLLKHIAHLCGFVVVKIPRVAFTKEEEIDIINEYQNATCLSVSLLKLYFRKTDLETLNRVHDSLREVIEKCVQNSRYAEKKLAGQLEMDI